jgi:putative sigma-54 modulation protein
MKLIYTGRQVELAPAQLKKIESRFAKIGKFLDGKEEREAHVILSTERHLHHAEVTVNYYNHQLVGIGSDGDLFTAINAAADKLEKQAIKSREKWRDSVRAPRKAGAAIPTAGDSPIGVRRSESEAEEEAREEETVTGQVFRVNHLQKRKPMTLDEALLEMENDFDYLVYRDAESDRVSVLIRRRDGNFDLIEA